MAVNGVEIKVGQVWRTRGGSLATVVANYGHEAFPWGLSEGSSKNPMLHSCANDGRILGDDGGDLDGDLMFLVSDPDIGTERRKQQEPNSPMRRKGDMIPVPETVPDLAASPADFATSVPGLLDETRVRNVPKPPCALPDHPEMTPFSKPQSALDVQIGGGHYKQFAIQPVEFIHKNGIPFIEGNCIKYLCRWRDKGGVEDLKKVKHYLDLLIEMESDK